MVCGTACTKTHMERHASKFFHMCAGAFTTYWHRGLSLHCSLNQALILCVLRRADASQHGQEKVSLRMPCLSDFSVFHECVPKPAPHKQSFNTFFAWYRAVWRTSVKTYSHACENLLGYQPCLKTTSVLCIVAVDKHIYNGWC